MRILRNPSTSSRVGADGWAQSEEGQQNNFADHVVRDVIGFVDSHYRTVAERKGRAINGISMGGFGAISLGLSHPELFSSIAAPRMV